VGEGEERKRERNISFFPEMGNGSKDSSNYFYKIFKHEILDIVKNNQAH
jgi:hypothetical protein